METKLDPVIKAKWVAALRSGGYKQGRGRLKSGNDEYCCLGVLCDVSGRGEWDNRNGNMFYVLPGSGAFGVYCAEGSVPDKLKEEIGLSVPQAVDLIQLNDHRDKTFVEIAAYVEEHL